MSSRCNPSKNHAHEDRFRRADGSRSRGAGCGLDGTLILFAGLLTGGTNFCQREGKAIFVVDAAQTPAANAIDGVWSFIDEQNIRVLNVAGPRGSGWDGGHGFAFDVVASVIGLHEERGGIKWL